MHLRCDLQQFLPGLLVIEINVALILLLEKVGVVVVDQFRRLAPLNLILLLHPILVLLQVQILILFEASVVALLRHPRERVQPNGGLL